MNNKTNSYTAANAMPIKIFKNPALATSLAVKEIPPFHVQLIPTNKCNLNCSFCSCKKRNKQDELTTKQIKNIMLDFAVLGCESVTITGGGEPLMHKEIDKVLETISRLHIEIGLVTNGLLLDKLNEQDFNTVKWCRVSCCDERPFDYRTETILTNAVERGLDVDWAFSYVVGKNYNPDNLNKYIAFANKNCFTHIRVVSDLCDLEHCDDMQNIRRQVTEDDSLVIWQGRKEYEPGQKNCWISLMKPVVGADGKIYLCWGVQYAHQEQDYDLPESMCMGGVENIHTIWDDQKRFNGKQCDRCYYKNYNDILDMMVANTEHVRFV